MVRESERDLVLGLCPALLLPFLSYRRGVMCMKREVPARQSVSAMLAMVVEWGIDSYSLTAGEMEPHSTLSRRHEE